MYIDTYHGIRLYFRNTVNSEKPAVVLLSCFVPAVQFSSFHRQPLSQVQPNYKKEIPLQVQVAGLEFICYVL